MDDVIPMAGKDEDFGITWHIEEVSPNYFTAKVEFCDLSWPCLYMTASSLPKAIELINGKMNEFKKDTANTAYERIDEIVYYAERLIKCVHIKFIRDLLLEEHSKVCDLYEEPLRSKLAEIIEVILK